MNLELLVILFYVPSMLAVILMTAYIVRSFGNKVNICLINMTVTSVAEIIRISGLVIPRWSEHYHQHVSLGQGIAEHIIYLSWVYSVLLYFIEQTHCMRTFGGRRKLPAKQEAVAVVVLWILVLAISISAVFGRSSEEPNHLGTPAGRYEQWQIRRDYFGIYLDDINLYIKREVDNTGLIIEAVCYVTIPLLAFAGTAIVAYRRWYNLMQSQFKCSLSPFKSTRGIEESQATPSGIEMMRVDCGEADSHTVTITPANTSSSFEWAMRMVSTNWFCTATFFILSISNLFMGLIWERYQQGFMPYFMGGARMFSCIGTISLILAHDSYLQHKN